MTIITKTIAAHKIPISNPVSGSSSETGLVGVLLDLLLFESSFPIAMNDWSSDLKVAEAWLVYYPSGVKLSLSVYKASAILEYPIPILGDASWVLSNTIISSYSNYVPMYQSEFS